MSERANVSTSHESEYCNPERLRLQRSALRASIYQNRSYMKHAWQILGLKSSLEDYVRELSNAAQTAEEEEVLRPVFLRLSMLEHIFSHWEDEESAISIHQCIMNLRRKKRSLQ